MNLSNDTVSYILIALRLLSGLGLFAFALSRMGACLNTKCQHNDPKSKSYRKSNTESDLNGGHLCNKLGFFVFKVKKHGQANRNYLG